MFVSDLAVYEGDSVSMSCQHSYWLRRVLSQSASVPHFTQRIITARKQQLWRNIGKCHSVHVVLVSINLKHVHTIKKMHTQNLLSDVGMRVFPYLQRSFVQLTVKYIQTAIVCAVTNKHRTPLIKWIKLFRYYYVIIIILFFSPSKITNSFHHYFQEVHISLWTSNSFFWHLLANL